MKNSTLSLTISLRSMVIVSPDESCSTLPYSRFEVREPILSSGVYGPVMASKLESMQRQQFLSLKDLQVMSYDSHSSLQPGYKLMKICCPLSGRQGYFWWEQQLASPPCGLSMNLKELGDGPQENHKQEVTGWLSVVISWDCVMTRRIAMVRMMRQNICLEYYKIKCSII